MNVCSVLKRYMIYDISIQEEQDIVSDLRVVTKSLFSRLDPSIRYHVKRPGLGVVQNTYTGFESEFINTDFGLNKLISVQLAVSTKTYLKIPVIKSYQISSLDVKTNNLIRLSRKSTVFNFKKIEGSVEMCIKEIKNVKYGKYDETMFILNESLRNIKGLSYYENDDYTIFTQPSSGIQAFKNILSSVKRLLFHEL